MKKDYIRELPTFILPNTGNMGIPICLFAYGEMGMGIAAAISSLVVLLHFTLNIFLAKRAFDFQTIFKSPAFYAVIITVLFLYFEHPVPQFVMNTVMLLAYGMIVMILMSLGVALTQMKVFSFTTIFCRPPPCPREKSAFLRGSVLAKKFPEKNQVNQNFPSFIQ